MWFSLAFLGGIVLGKLVSLSLTTWLVLATLALIAALFSRIVINNLPPSPRSLSSSSPLLLSSSSVFSSAQRATR